MNPYTPPDANLHQESTEPLARRHPYAFFILGLAVAQLIWVSTYVGSYFSLITTGSVSMLAALGSVIGCGLFYAAAISFVADASRGGYRFLAAAVGLGLSSLGWNWQYHVSYPILFGAAAALLGWWLVQFYCHSRSDQ